MQCIIRQLLTPQEKLDPAFEVSLSSDRHQPVIVLLSVLLEEE